VGFSSSTLFIWIDGFCQPIPIEEDIARRISRLGILSLAITDPFTKCDATPIGINRSNGVNRRPIFIIVYITIWLTWGRAGLVEI
jgi:hypothetical protein